MAWPSDSMVAVTPKMRLANGLGKTTASVTEFLEHLVGEPVDALDRHHVTTPAPVSNLLGVEGGHRLLARSTVLRGRTSGQPFLYAESLLVPSRLPAGFCGHLRTSSDPIGRILSGYGIEFTRSPLPDSERQHATVFAGFPRPDQHLLARTYQITINREPAMVISEWFLPTLARFLGTC
jgi:chorismate--pyruvate lyase